MEMRTGAKEVVRVLRMPWIRVRHDGQSAEASDLPASHSLTQEHRPCTASQHSKDGRLKSLGIDLKGRCSWRDVVFLWIGRQVSTYGASPSPFG